MLNDHGAIVKSTSSAICRSDLRLPDGYVPTMQKGDTIGYEFMGDVIVELPEEYHGPPRRVWPE
jgi:threonine dehydrogenase-like Zn-dependent dehydrogenase